MTAHSPSNGFRAAAMNKRCIITTSTIFIFIIIFLLPIIIIMMTMMVVVSFTNEVFQCVRQTILALLNQIRFAQLCIGITCIWQATVLALNHSLSIYHQRNPSPGFDLLRLPSSTWAPRLTEV